MAAGGICKGAHPSLCTPTGEGTEAPVKQGIPSIEGEAVLQQGHTHGFFTLVLR